MKTHLAKITKRAGGTMMTGFACDNNPFKKGRTVNINEFEASNNKCKKCENSYTYKKLIS